MRAKIFGMQAAGMERRARRAALGRRLFDVVGACVLLLITAPAAALCAIAVFLQDGEPVIFRQARVGLKGAPFLLLKFRSMHVDAESDGVARWARVDDERVTAFGRFMRRTRLDELPQLVNVLRGEMSLIGPRPERPAFVDTLSKEIPNYSVRHTVKPGITGWAQVRLGYTASTEEASRKLHYDLFYIRNRSLLLDLRILFETLGVVVFTIGSR
jgi:lipopolysaccharide/colanic/teichoic acid biosynthesis glycosyltransferase